MKRIIAIFILFSSLFFLHLVSPNQIQAQFCGDPCSGPGDCDPGFNLECTGGICNGDMCPLCTGDSGYLGVCELPSSCRQGGRTVDGDGTPSCTTYGKMCCTTAPSGETCQLSSPGPFALGFEFRIYLTSSTPNTTYNITSLPATCLMGSVTTDGGGNAETFGNCTALGNYTATARHGSTECSFSFTVTMSGEPDPCTQVCCLPDDCETAIQGNYVCPDPNWQCCTACASGWGGGGPAIVDCPSGGKGIVTAIGCIPFGNTNAFIKFLLTWGMGIGGGIAFLLILFAGFQIITSTGDPKRLQAGKELLTSAVAGLLLIIFSVFILRLIGADILGIFQ